ncbi:LicD family protein [Primorskyibacter sp. S187A]|uniref:LicD family protein n=1 Tax=Primorskyibacter sp. S187A TaxID=3415130 RepID=UPI003C7CA70B
MRRQLFDLYHAHLARPLRHVPGGLRGRVAGHLFQATRHPDFAFAHARMLTDRGQQAEASKLYGGPEAAPVEDPLFAARLQSAGKEPPALPAPLRGFLQAQIGYLGLRVSASLKTAEPVELTLELDGCVLRRETLQSKAGRAVFRMIIARPVLERFPPEALLQARVNGALLPTSEAGAGWQIHMPHGQGDIARIIEARGPLSKKGQFRLNSAELEARQGGYLALYSALKDVFAEDFQRPLVVLYGTLLGQVRAQDFIPGDDDFDVGYAAPQTDPDAVRSDALEIMARLAARGFVIGFNEQARPFRIRQEGGDVWCHLDNRPVFSPEAGSREVWLHKHAALPLPLSHFEAAETAVMRGTEILRPQHPEQFLEAYYGQGWQVPDPGYTNTGRSLPPQARRALARLCLSDREQRDLAARYPSNVVPVRHQALYPLSGYAARVGF